MKQEGCWLTSQHHVCTALRQVTHLAPVAAAYSYHSARDEVPIVGGLHAVDPHCICHKERSIIGGDCFWHDGRHLEDGM